jgi:hypothetical protein
MVMQSSNGKVQVAAAIVQSVEQVSFFLPIYSSDLSGYHNCILNEITKLLDNNKFISHCLVYVIILKVSFVIHKQR